MKKEDIHILVVDDEDLILNMFQQSLENWGYRVDTATNGQEALRRCQENSYHVVITDLNMPELDGMGLLKRIKARWPFIEVIVVTGFATIEAAIEAMKMGAYDFILKPVNFDQVKFTVNNCYLKIKAQSENEELRELNAQLKELNDMKDKFLSITNHEIRTPLTIIRGYLEILNDLLEEPDSEIKEIIEILNAATRDLYDTVERIHILYKLNKGSRFARMEEVEITTIVNQVGKEMRRLFEYRQIHLRMEVPSQEVYIWANARGVQLVVRELLQNALKFTPDGGRVRIKIHDMPDQAVICVKDNGIGIPYNKLDLVFSEFYEVQDAINHTSSRESFMGGGMGIGLSLVKEIVSDMKGKVIVDSEPGAGATFLLYFPKGDKQLEKIENITQQQVIHES